MGAIVSQITSLPIVYPTVDSGADQSKHQSSASLAFVRGIHRGPVKSPHKWPVMWKMFPFDYVIMKMHLYHHWQSIKFPVEIHVREIYSWVANLMKVLLSDYKQFKI